MHEEGVRNRHPFPPASIKEAEEQLTWFDWKIADIENQLTNGDRASDPSDEAKNWRFRATRARDALVLERGNVRTWLVEERVRLRMVEGGTRSLRVIPADHALLLALYSLYTVAYHSVMNDEERAGFVEARRMLLAAGFRDPERGL